MLVEIIILIIILAILILPIKIAADYVGASSTGVLMCIAALVLAVLIQGAVAAFLPMLAVLHPIVNSLVSLLLSAFAYMLVLGTTYVKGIVIAILQTILTVGMLFIVGLLGIGMGSIIMPMSI